MADAELRILKRDADAGDPQAVEKYARALARMQPDRSLEDNAIRIMEALIARVDDLDHCMRWRSSSEMANAAVDWALRIRRGVNKAQMDLEDAS